MMDYPPTGPNPGHDPTVPPPPPSDQENMMENYVNWINDRTEIHYIFVKLNI